VVPYESFYVFMFSSSVRRLLYLGCFFGPITSFLLNIMKRSHPAFLRRRKKTKHPLNHAHKAITPSVEILDYINH
jgi:hypothetical protein